MKYLILVELLLKKAGTNILGTFNRHCTIKPLYNDDSFMLRITQYSRYLITLMYLVLITEYPKMNSKSST